MYLLDGKMIPLGWQAFVRLLQTPNLRKVIDNKHKMGEDNRHHMGEDNRHHIV